MRRNNTRDLDAEIQENQNACELDDAKEVTADEKDPTATKRGRRALPIAWTRVMLITPGMSN